MMDKKHVLRLLASAVEVLESAESVDPLEVALLCQYMLTAYLTTVPAFAKVEMDVLELIHGLLPTGIGLSE